MIELAIDALFRAEPEAVRDWATRALGAARELGERPLIAAAAAMLALGHAVAGSIGEAQAAYAEATALVAAMSDEELAARVDAAAYLCSAATFLDRYDEAVAHAERALRLGRAAGHLHPTLIPALGAAHFMRGRLSEAAEVLDAGVEAARLAGITQSMAWMLRNRSLLSAMAGDLPAALEMAEEALELTRRLDESVLSAWAAMAVARASVMAGRSQRAVDVLEGVRGRRAAAEDPRRVAGDGPRGLATAHADLDHGDEAARAAAAAEAHAAALGLPMATAWAQRAAAAVALHAGEPAAAAERALASAAAAEQVGAVIEAALSRTLAGRALAAAGEHGPRGSRARARGGDVRGLRRAPAPRCRRAGAAPARANRPPAHAPRAAPTAWASRRSPNASVKSPPWSSTARPTPRSPPSSSSASRRSRRTCATSSASSTSPRGSSSREPWSAPAARPERQ